MAISPRVGQLRQSTEVTSTAASFAVFFVQADGSSSCTTELSLDVAVKATDRS
jgi:hypothetical protein